MTALDDRPTVTCEHYRRGQDPCGSTDGLVRLFIGWMCREHTLPGAQVYEAAPHLQGGALLGPGLVVTDTGGLRAPGAGQHPDTTPAPDVAGGRPLASVTPLPNPARPTAAVHHGARGAEAKAASMVMGRTGTPRRRLLERIASLGDQGSTSWEAWTWYCQTHGQIDLYSLRPRLSELKRDGWIHPAGHFRHPRGDGTADAPAEEVLVLSARGRAQLAQGGAR